MTVARRGEVRREEKLERETREWERPLLANPPPFSTPAKQATFHLSLTATSLKTPLTAVPKVAVVERSQPPPQALRFSHGRGERETSDWWWTTRDHGKGTNGRRSPLSPSRLPLRGHFHQKRDVWVRGRERSSVRKCEKMIFDSFSTRSLLRFFFCCYENSSQFSNKRDIGNYPG